MVSTYIYTLLFYKIHIVVQQSLYISLLIIYCFLDISVRCLEVLLFFLRATFYIGGIFLCFGVGFWVIVRFMVLMVLIVLSVVRGLMMSPTESIPISTVAKASGVFLPGGRISLWLTIFFIFVVLVVGVSDSVRDNSLFPLFKVAVQTVGADSGLFDVVTFHSVPPSYSSYFSKNFFDFCWFEFVFWLKVLSFLWFLWVVAWLLYKGFDAVYNASPFLSVLMTVVAFVFLQFLVSVMVFNLSLSSAYPHQTTDKGVLVLLPSDDVEFFNSMLSSAYPFHGVVALYQRFFDVEWFYNVKSFGESDFGSLIFNPVNISKVIG